MVQGDELLALQKAVRTIHVSEEVKEYIVAIAERRHGTTAASTWERRPAAPWPSSGSRKPSRYWRSVTTRSPDDVKALAYPGAWTPASSSARQRASRARQLQMRLPKCWTRRR